MPDLNDAKHLYIQENFNRITLTATEINAKEFDNCIFEACNFSESTFLNCKFYECKFINCNLSMIQVNGSSFFDVIFDECKAIGINWTKASWPRIKLCSPFRFNKCVLNHSSFLGLGLKEVVMIECKAKEVDFRDADCTEANFSYTDFANSFFGKTILTKADFSEAINYNIDIFNNVLSKAKFSLPEAVNLLNCMDIELVD